jgi:hypothetical protein
MSAIVALLLILTAAVILVGCDEDEKKPIIHWKVFRENADGNYTMWTMTEKPEAEEGFLCWTEKEGNEICISGKITLQSFIAGEE